jgi:hypothetical protein
VLLSTCAEAAFVVTLLLAAIEAAGERAAARMGSALGTRTARENIVSGGLWVVEGKTDFCETVESEKLRPASLRKKRSRAVLLF